MEKPASGSFGLWWTLPDRRRDMSSRLFVHPLSLALNSRSLPQALLQGTLFRPLVANIYIKNFLCVFFFAQSTVAQEKDPLAQAQDALEIVADQKNSPSLATDRSHFFKTLLLE